MTCAETRRTVHNKIQAQSLQPGEKARIHPEKQMWELIWRRSAERTWDVRLRRCEGCLREDGGGVVELPCVLHVLRATGGQSRRQQHATTSRVKATAASERAYHERVC